jgi:hypothetical protein
MKTSRYEDAAKRMNTFSASESTQKLGGNLGKTRKNAATFLFFALITNVKLNNIERL